jgi:hypothetical protein
MDFFKLLVTCNLSGYASLARDLKLHPLLAHVPCLRWLLTLGGCWVAGVRYD